MAWMRVLVVLTALIERDYGENNVTSVLYPNGCVLLGMDATIQGRVGHDTRSPFLNCSHLYKSSFDMSGFPLSIANMNLARNNLTVFDMANIKRFRKLEQLDLRSNKIHKFEDSGLPIHSIQDAHLSNNDLARVPKRFLCSAPKTANLDLTANKIFAIFADDFVCLENLRTLSLASNPLNEISVKAFEKISKTLSKLVLSFTGLREVPDVLSTVPELTYLSLTNNKISSIPANAFSALRKLQWLFLSNNKIARIDSKAFKGPVQLQFLDLTDNLIETLEKGVFDFENEDQSLCIEMYSNPLRCDCSLRWLKLWTDSLAHNDVRYQCEQPSRVHGMKSYELTLSDFVCYPNEYDWTGACTTVTPMTVNFSMPDDACPERCNCFHAGRRFYSEGSTTAAPMRRSYGHWSLRETQSPHVDCSNADFARLPMDTRKDVKTLTMKGNLLDVLYIADLAEYSSLVQLDLEGCGLERMKPSATVMLHNLTVLLLQRNELTTFGRNHLASFPNLRVLDLSHNKFMTFPNNMFSYNRYLHHLYLGSNPVRNFDLRLFYDLDLRELSLRNLSLDHVPMLTLDKLTFLDASNNNITTIRDHTFVRTPSLLHLAINSNKITMIEQAAFKGAFNLRYLDLSDNKISTLPSGVFKDFSGDGLQIDLWRNNLFCDCRMKWFKAWIERLEAKNPLTDIRFICFHPRRMQDKISDHLMPSNFVCETGDGTVEDWKEIGRSTANLVFSFFVAFTLVGSVLAIGSCSLRKLHVYRARYHLERLLEDSPRLRQKCNADIRPPGVRNLGQELGTSHEEYPVLISLNPSAETSRARHHQQSPAEEENPRLRERRNADIDQPNVRYPFQEVGTSPEEYPVVISLNPCAETSRARHHQQSLVEEENPRLRERSNADIRQPNVRYPFQELGTSPEEYPVVISLNPSAETSRARHHQQSLVEEENPRLRERSNADIRQPNVRYPFQELGTSEEYPVVISLNPSASTSCERRHRQSLVEENPRLRERRNADIRQPELRYLFQERGASYGKYPVVICLHPSAATSRRENRVRTKGNPDQISSDQSTAASRQEDLVQRNSHQTAGVSRQEGLVQKSLNPSMGGSRQDSIRRRYSV